jgi:hypothetical protein
MKKRFVTTALFLTLTCNAFAEIALFTVAREVTKFTHTASGEYIPLEYAMRPNVASHAEISISLAGTTKRSEVVPWEDVSSVCNVSQINQILLKTNFLDPKSSVEETIGKISRQIVNDREKFLACGLDTIATTLVQEDTLPISEGVGQRVMTVYSTIYNLKGRFAALKAQELSRFRSQSFPISSSPPRLTHSEAFKVHAEKLFNSLVK